MLKKLKQRDRTIKTIKTIKMESSIILIQQPVGKNIASFDLDHTLIKPNGTRVFPKDKDDWVWMDSVKNKLIQLHNNDWSIVIFTNQKQTKRSLTVEDLQHKFTQIQKDIPVPLTFVAALETNYYRKPYPGMWKRIIDSYDQAFYCGDRETDMFFAMNANIPFVEPEDMFKEQSLIIKPTTKNIKMSTPMKEQSKHDIKTEQKKLSEFIKAYDYLFIISPVATGKTTFSKKYLPEYLRLSKDDYSTKQKYMNEVKANIHQKIVFDNINHTESGRQQILDILDTDKVGFIYREVTKEETMYMNKYRHFVTEGKRPLLPEIAIHTYFKNVEIPTKNTIRIGHWITDLVPFVI